METFAPIFSQMIFLFAFIIIGFVLVKCKFIPENSSQVLSRLETLLFIPALMMGVFLQNCTVERIETMWKLLLSGFIVVAILIPLSFFVAKLCYKEAYLQKITTYGLAFSNFAYMGNAIVAAVFPAMYVDYLVFCLPLWLLIYGIHLQEQQDFSHREPSRELSHYRAPLQALQKHSNLQYRYLAVL